MASHKKRGTDVTENVTMCDSVQRDSSEQGGKKKNWVKKIRGLKGSIEPGVWFKPYKVLSQA